MRARLKQLVRDVVRDHRADALDIHRAFPIRAGDIVMLGDSLTEGGDWAGAFPGLPMRNRGIGGEVSAETSQRLSEITDGVPASVFVMIGTNDLTNGVETSELSANVATIIDRIEKQSPASRVVLQSLLPRGDRHNNRIGEANLALRRIANDRKVTYLDLHHDFADHRGRLEPSLTVDGVHLSGAGYSLWVNRLRPMMQYSPSEVDLDLTDSSTEKAGQAPKPAGTSVSEEETSEIPAITAPVAPAASSVKHSAPSAETPPAPPEPPAPVVEPEPEDASIVVDLRPVSEIVAEQAKDQAT